MDELKINNGAQKQDIKTTNTINIFRIVKTFLLACGLVSMGMTHSIQYTTIPDMRIRLQTSAYQLSLAMSAGAIGGCIGGPTASLADRFSKYTELIISMSLFTTATSFVMFPFSGSLWFLGTMIFFFSFSLSLFQGAAHAEITQIWGTSAGPARYAMHFGYPIGNILGPLIALPFVSTKDETTQNKTVLSNSTDTWFDTTDPHNTVLYILPDTNTTGKGANVVDITERNYLLTTLIPVTEDTSKIEYSYIIASLLIVINASLFMYFQFCRQKNQSHNVCAQNISSFKQLMSPSKWASGDGCFGIMILLFSMMYIIIHIATMTGTQQFLVTYAVDSGMFTNQRAALLNSMVSVAGTSARGFAIVLSGYITAPYIIFIGTHGQFVFAVLCLIFGTRSSNGLWITAIGLGFFRDILFPTTYIWMDYYIILFGVLVGLTDTGGYLFSSAITPFQGYLYDNTTIASIFYTTVGFGFAQCILVTVMSWYASRKGGRKSKMLELNEAMRSETTLNSKEYASGNANNDVAKEEMISLKHC